MKEKIFLFLLQNRIFWRNEKNRYSKTTFFAFLSSFGYACHKNEKPRFLPLCAASFSGTAPSVAETCFARFGVPLKL